MLAIETKVRILRVIEIEGLMISSSVETLRFSPLSSFIEAFADDYVICH